MIGRKIDLRLTLPPLPGANAKGHAAAGAKDVDQAQGAVSMLTRRTGQKLKPHDNQAIACQHCQRFGIGAMQRRLAPAHVGIVETGQIVMHEACTMDHLQCGSCGIR